MFDFAPPGTLDLRSQVVLSPASVRSAYDFQVKMNLQQN
jgi:hypothetical protein